MTLPHLKAFVITLISGLLVLILSAFSSFATTYKVPTQIPYLSTAINTAKTGDTILVSPGVYSGHLNRMFRLNGKNLKIFAVAGPETTVIKLNNAQGFFIVEGEDSTTIIRGFTIQGGDAGPEWSEDYRTKEAGGGAFRIYNSSPLIENCIIEYNTGFYGSAVFVNGYEKGAKPIFRNCIFRNNTNFWGAGAAASLNNEQSTFINCLFLRNQTAWGSALFINHSQSTFVNCTFIGNESRGKGASQTITAWYSSNTPTFTRCIIWGTRTAQISTTPFEEESTFNPIIENSVIFGNPDYPGLLDLDPSFTDTLVYNSGLMVDGLRIGSFFELPPGQTQSAFRFKTFHFWLAGVGLSTLFSGFLLGFFISKRMQKKSLEIKTENQNLVLAPSRPEIEKQVFQPGIYCFGEFKIIAPDGSNLIPELPAKCREVLGWLLIKANDQEVSVSGLIDEVWMGEKPPSINTVNNHLSKIHKLTEKLPQWLILKRTDGMITLHVDEPVYWDCRIVTAVIRNGKKPEQYESQLSELKSCLEKGMIFTGFLSDWAGTIQYEYQTRLLGFLNTKKDDKDQQSNISALFRLLLKWNPSDPDLIKGYYQALLTAGKTHDAEAFRTAHQRGIKW